MVTVGAEGGDKEGGMIVEGVIPGDGKEEVILDIFILGAPNFLAMLVNDGVLVQIVSDSYGIR
jgi:hypothetical protein